MSDPFAVDLKPHFVDAPMLRIAGTRAHYTAADKQGMADQWRQFAPRMDTIAQRVGRVGWGVVANMSGDGVDYVAGVEVATIAGLPADLVQLSIPAQRYAAFAHRLEAARIGEAMHAIFQLWLPRSGLRHARGGPADLLERYGEAFDPQTGTGDIELWLPIAQ